jgi:CheY-like chemotaxis protein
MKFVKNYRTRLRLTVFVNRRVIIGLYCVRKRFQQRHAQKVLFMPTILIVEDNALTQRVLQLTLANQSYQVIVAGNGFEAIERLEHTQVDLAVVDVAMPLMDGLALLRYLRDHDRYETLPVVMLTANSQDSIRSQALAIGADGFLTKPTSSRELLDTVSRFVYAQT